MRASRARILEAADRARRDIERNLHDGAQQRLVSVALGLQHLARHAQRPARRLPRARAARRSTSCGTGLGELRDLARGLHPAVLSDHGLEHALRALAQRAAVPVELETALPGERLPMAVEAAAYFVVSEALTNVARYAQASHAWVSVEERDGEVEVTVGDDGVGGARRSAPDRACRACATGSRRSTGRSRSTARRAAARGVRAAPVAPNR